MLMSTKGALKSPNLKKPLLQQLMQARMLFWMFRLRLLRLRIRMLFRL